MNSSRNLSFDTYEILEHLLNMVEQKGPDFEMHQPEQFDPLQEKNEQHFEIPK